MLFFTRAFICIGTVVVLAEGLAPADVVRDAAGTLTPATLQPAATLCRIHPDTCLAVATAAIHAIPPDETATLTHTGAGRLRPVSARRGSTRLPELSSRPLMPR